MWKALPPIAVGHALSVGLFVIIAVLTQACLSRRCAGHSSSAEFKIYRLVTQTSPVGGNAYQLRDLLMVVLSLCLAPDLCKYVFLA
jgi:hypothetical protein